VVDDTFESVVSQQIILAVVGFASPVVLFLVIFPLAGLTLAPAVVLLVAGACAAIGFVAPPAVLRGQARARRAEFAASVSHYVSFVEVMVSGGHSIDGAFEFAADLGEGWAWDEIRFAIASASSATLAPYRALEQLGDELDVPELSTLARRLGQTQVTGSAIGPALRALSDGLAADRARKAKIEDDQVTEKMTFPLMVILVALLTFFGIAAVTAILRAAETL
jgi:Flp pilus assembly protein TadB